jgi:hypothetical protein
MAKSYQGIEDDGPQTLAIRSLNRLHWLAFNAIGNLAQVMKAATKSFAFNASGRDPAYAARSDPHQGHKVVYLIANKNLGPTWVRMLPN